MRNLTLGLFLFVGFSGPAQACDTQSVEEARQILERSTDRYNKGTLTSSELQVATSHWLEMRLCQSPTDKRICAKLIDSLQRDFENAQSGVAAGTVKFAEFLRTHEKLARTRANCTR